MMEVEDWEGVKVNLVENHIVTLEETDIIK